MHKNVFLLLKNCKNRLVLAPRPQPLAAVGGTRSQPSIENSWLRHWTAPSRTGGRGLRQGEHFTDKEKGSMFCDFDRTSFMDDPLFTPSV